MAQAYMQPIDHPSAWTASGLGSLDAVTVHWEQRHIDALEEAYEKVAAAGLTLNDLEPDHFALPAIAGELRQLYEEVMWGRGIVVIDRLPVEDWPIEKAEMIYWGLGSHFGTPQSQSSMGDRVGHVVNAGGKDHNERAYRNSLPLSLHTDLCDILAMLSIRTADEGGESQYASALAVHNAILAEKPEHLGPLYRGFRYHRFGEQQPGQPDVTDHEVPVLSERDGQVSCRYVAGYIYMAYEELESPLSQEEQDALDYFDAVAARPEVRFEFVHQPGQMLVCNNHIVLHSRTGFEDRPGPETGRLLLRLWINAHDGERRPTDRSIEIFEDDGGIASLGRDETRYRGDSTRILSNGRRRY